MTDGLYFNDYSITHIARTLIPEIRYVFNMADLEKTTNSSRSTCDQYHTGEMSFVKSNLRTNEGNTSSFSESANSDLSERPTKLVSVQTCRIFKYYFHLFSFQLLRSITEGKIGILLVSKSKLHEMFPSAYFLIMALGVD